jgi:hypothetical protein
MLVRPSSIGNNVLYESGSQVGIRIGQSPEFHEPALESPDQPVNVEGEPSSVTEPVSVTTRVATPRNIGGRVTVDKPASKNLVQPFVTTTRLASWRRRPSHCARLVQEIAHANPEEFMETRKVRARVF